MDRRLVKVKRARAGVSHDSQELLATIAEYYYLAGLSQAKIASRLNLSRSYISRLLKKAREAKIVEIYVNRPIPTVPELERRIITAYGLKDCIVVAGSDVDPDVSLQQAGKAAASYICNILDPSHTVALAWGTGVKAIVDSIQSGQARAKWVVQMFGGLGAKNNDISGAALVARLAGKLNSEFQLLHAPWIVESKELAQALKAQPDVASTLERARLANIACVGIGATGQGSSLMLFNRTYLTTEELKELYEANAIGDICARVFDPSGTPCDLSFNSRIIGLDLPTIQQIPIVIGIAVGSHKGPAITAALKGRLINVLVTDRAAALQVLYE